MGDNQFFGVNHMSEEKGMSSARRFQDNKAIIEVIDTAYQCGIHAFSFSTHDRVKFICDHFREHRDKYMDLRLYPCLPYAQKYAHAVNEKGLVGAIKDVLVSDNSAGQMFSMMASGVSAVIKQDPTEIMKLLVDAEMKMFRGLNVKVVFLQNIITDMILGLGFKDVFKEYARHIEQKYQAKAGFMTLNMPMLVQFLEECGVEDPIVCSAINKVGFQMNPGVEAYEKQLNTGSFNAMAMSVMAAGAVPPREALEYVTQFRNIRSIFFGASSRAHIQQTKDMIEELDDKTRFHTKKKAC